MVLADVLLLDAILFYDASSFNTCPILTVPSPIQSSAGVCAQGFIGQASKAATEGQEAVKGLNQKEQAVILQVRTHGQSGVNMKNITVQHLTAEHRAVQ